MFLKKKSFLVLIALIILSFSINQFFGYRGIFPIDSFAFFDTSYKITTGEVPIKDYWISSGLTLDFLQAIIFSIFGTSWHTYIFHASLFNVLITISTYLLFNHLGLNKSINFLLSACVSILAYTSSGTPFVDHHSTFLSLFALYSLIMAIYTNQIIFWRLIPPFFVLAFFSKQVPAAFFILSTIFIISFYLFLATNILRNKVLKNLIYSSTLSLIIFIFVCVLYEINLRDLFIQYIAYPINIGSNRYSSNSLDLINLVSEYKYIHICYLPFLYLSYVFLKKKKNFYLSKEFFLALVITSIYIFLIVHQSLTKNQNFIFFLIPIFSGFSCIIMSRSNYKFKNQMFYFLIFVSIISTTKYHERFNIERKFHEFSGADFTKSISSKNIHPILSGLNWITPDFRQNPSKEISGIKYFLDLVRNEKNNKMVITNYSFVNAIIKGELNQISRWYPVDGTGFPFEKNNDYYNIFRDFITNRIKEKKINTIIITSDIPENFLGNYLNMECLIIDRHNHFVKRYYIKKNCEL